VPEVAGGGPVPLRLLWRIADTIQNRSPAAPAPINSQPQPGRPSESSESVWLFAAAAAAAPAAAALPWFVLVGFVLAGCGVVWVLITVFVCVGAVTVFVGAVTVFVWVMVVVGGAGVAAAAAGGELVDFVFVSAARATPHSATVASAVAPATRMAGRGRLRAV
jgi:hypothetical protein